MIYEIIVEIICFAAFIAALYFFVIKKLLYKRLSKKVDLFRAKMKPGTNNIYLKVLVTTNRGTKIAYSKCEILRITKFSTAPYLVRFKANTNTNGLVTTKNVKHTDLYPSFIIPNKYLKK